MILSAGSEGKLALPPERMGVLSGVKGLSNSGIMGSSSQQTIATSVCDMIIPYLKQEGKQPFNIMF